MVARDRERHHQWNQAGDQHPRTEEIDVADGRGRAHIRHRGDYEKDGDDPHRQVHIEDPAPAPAVSDVSPGCRADDGGEPNTAPNRPARRARWLGGDKSPRTAKTVAESMPARKSSIGR